MPETELMNYNIYYLQESETGNLHFITNNAHKNPTSYIIFTIIDLHIYIIQNRLS